MEVDIGLLKQQVQHNCDISDASHGGLYSLCSLLLRLRDLYKWEQGLRPWQEPEPADLLEWVDMRERRWEDIAHSQFIQLTIGNDSFHAFDTTAINARLRAMGLVYGAGYAAGLKPSFFLAESVRSVRYGDLSIDVVDSELARDLFIAPAMRQGNQIFARRSAMLFLICDHVLEMRPSSKDALGYALAQYDLDIDSVRRSPQNSASELDYIARTELDTFIFHEIGEAREDVFQAQEWHEIISTYSNGPIEIYARVIKDMLADTHTDGFLGHIISHRKKSSLGFYVSFMRPFNRLMFPEILEAFDQFRSHDDWEVIRQARETGYSKARDCGRHLVDLHKEGSRNGAEWARSQIMSKLIEPLGILSSLKEEDQ